MSYIFKIYVKSLGDTMDKKIVRAYLLRKAAIYNKKRPLGEALLYEIKLGFIFLLVFLGILYLVGVLGDNSNIFTKIIFWIIFLSVPIIFTLGFRSCKREFAYFQKKYVNSKSSLIEPILITGGTTGVIGTGFARRVEVSQETGMILILICSAFLVINFSYITPMYCYDYYLLKKYCPSLRKYRHTEKK